MLLAHRKAVAAVLVAGGIPDPLPPSPQPPGVPPDSTDPIRDPPKPPDPVPPPRADQRTMRIPTKSAGDSERRRPPIPIEAGQGFR
jgi:hypothetical protein